MALVLQVLVATFLAPPFNLTALWDAMATAQLEARLKAMRDAGEPTTMAEVGALYFDPPPGQNAAPLFHRAFELMDKVADDAARLNPQVPIDGPVDLPEPGEPMLPAMLGHIRAYLDLYREPLRLIHQATALDHCKFDLDLAAGPRALWPHLARMRMRQAARLLALEAVERAESGKPGEAAASLCACLRLGRALEQEPALVSALVSMGCDAVALSQVERWVVRSRPSAAAFERLEAALAAAATASRLDRVLLAERCFGIAVYQQRIQQGGEGRFAELVGRAAALPAPLLRLLPAAYFKADQARYIDLMTAYVRAARRPYPERLQLGARLAEDLKTRTPQHYLVCREMLPTLGRVFAELQRRSARCESARMALAALRYRARHGRLPESLQALVPALVESVALDPFDGQPLRYRTSPDGFVIYSVGENGQDDGGEVQGLGRPPGDAGFRVRWPQTEF